MRTIKIQGSDLTEITPVNSVIHLAGIVQSPKGKVKINWEVDGSSGTTICEAWRGQYEIESLSRAGYWIISVSKG